MSFNLQGAMNATMNPNIVGSKSGGYCARGVRTILEHGGINTSGRPNWAIKYINYLPTIGFGHLKTITGKSVEVDQFTKNEAKPGDIAVYARPDGKHPYGHICIYNGTNWCSDFRQRSINVYSAYSITAYIFRWNGKIDYNAIQIAPAPILSTPAPSFMNSSSSTMSSFSSNLDQSVFSDPSQNGMSITTHINIKNETVKHTRIYSTLEKSITVSELALPMGERTIPLDSQTTNNNQVSA